MAAAVTVGVVGLGKLGLPLALVLAEAGHTVHVWDIDKDAREAVKTRTAPAHIDEPDVEALLAAVDLRVTPPALMSNLAEVIYLVVPTPSLATGDFDVEYVQAALDSLRPTGRGQTAVVSLVSTVSPGAGKRLASLASELTLRYVYTPVMIALGSVVRDLRHPPFQLIGYDTASDDSFQAAARSAAVLRSLCPGTYIPRFMSYGSAEVAKLASNAFSTMRVAYVNLLGQLCERYYGNINDVTSALALQPFIGPHLFTAGAGFGGPCWPRDTLAFDAAGGQPLGATIDELNGAHVSWTVARVIEEALARGASAHTFSVLGREYKDGCNYRIESFGDKVATRLAESYGLEAVPSNEADIIVLALPLRDFKLCGHLKPGAIVLDLWRAHGYLVECPVIYLPFGIGSTT